MEYITLNNDVKIPVLGFGTYRLDPDITVNLLLEAFNEGVRHIDTASYYKNEHLIGTALKQSKLPREEFFITTKCWYEDMGYDKTLAAFESSLDELGLDYVDLYLIHWPSSLTLETWRAFETIYRSGKARAIGVCNFEIDDLEALLTQCEIIPMVNQIELHPFNTRSSLVKYCKEHKIAVESWAPLAKGRIFDHEILKSIAQKLSCTVAQLVLRWHFQKGYITFPKASSIERIRNNMDIFDLQISDEDMQLIDSLNEDFRVSNYPVRP